MNLREIGNDWFQLFANLCYREIKPSYSNHFLTSSVHNIKWCFVKFLSLTKMIHFEDIIKILETWLESLFGAFIFLVRLCFWCVYVCVTFCDLRYIIKSVFSRSLYGLETYLGWNPTYVKFIFIQTEIRCWSRWQVSNCFLNPSNIVRLLNVHQSQGSVCITWRAL